MRLGWLEMVTRGHKAGSREIGSVAIGSEQFEEVDGNISVMATGGWEVCLSRLTRFTYSREPSGLQN